MLSTDVHYLHTHTRAHTQTQIPELHKKCESWYGRLYILTHTDRTVSQSLSLSC